MAYRTYINGKQIFGNNDSYKEYFDFLKSKGVEINEDDSYEGEIDDVMGLFAVIDKITRQHILERHDKVKKGEKDFITGNPLKELMDLSVDKDWFENEQSVLAQIMYTLDNYTCFMPYQAYDAVKHQIERTPSKRNDDYYYWLRCNYKLKPGEKIKVEAR